MQEQTDDGAFAAVDTICEVLKGVQDHGGVLHPNFPSHLVMWDLTHSREHLDLLVGDLNFSLDVGLPPGALDPG